MRYEFARTAPPDGFPAFHDIPTERHISDEFHDLEQEFLWPNTWVIAGRVEDVAEPGDYITFDDLGVPLLIVRGTDGEIRCFYNTCQHRGAPVVREDRGVRSPPAVPVPLVDLRDRRRHTRVGARRARLRRPRLDPTLPAHRRVATPPPASCSSTGTLMPHPCATGSGRPGRCSSRSRANDSARSTGSHASCRATGR